MAKRKGTNTGVPGLSFSAKRATGVTRAKQNIARKTGVPTTRSGRQRKFGKAASGGCLTLIIQVAMFVALITFAIIIFI
jgi:hypothetical protein